EQHRLGARCIKGTSAWFKGFWKQNKSRYKCRKRAMYDQ
ncbi:MAG: hypothetical protein ACI80I_002640, partial [Akkermansiaceae bacterium]